MWEVLARLARAERIKASAHEFDVDRHTVIEGTGGAKKRGGSLGDQFGREKDQGEPAQLDIGGFRVKQGKVVPVCRSFNGTG